jgi:hypothetical protein
MKEKLTIELSRHQAKVLNSALQLVNDFLKLPPNKPLYNLPTEGIASDLVKTEFILIREEIVRQLEEQDNISS